VRQRPAERAALISNEPNSAITRQRQSDSPAPTGRQVRQAGFACQLRCLPDAARFDPLRQTMDLQIDCDMEIDGSGQGCDGS